MLFRSVYQDQQNYSLAIDDFAKAIEFNHLVADIFCNRGYVYNRLHQYAKAIEDFYVATNIDSECTGAYLGRGRSYLGLYKFEKALTDINEAIALDERFPSGYILRALVFRMMGNEKEAIKNEEYATDIKIKIMIVKQERRVTHWSELKKR